MPVLPSAKNFAPGLPNLSRQISGRDVLFLINRGSSPSYNSVYTAQKFSALDFCKDVLEIFRENPKGWSEYTKGSNRTAEEIETELTRLADEIEELLNDI